MGYMHLQATKPDTLAQGLTDSPSGLLAYILEKYSSWSFDYESKIVGRKDGGLENFNRDDLLTITTIYWMSNSISSSVRFYKNFFDLYGKSDGFETEMMTSKISEKVFVGVQYGINELALSPSKLIKLRYQNLVKYEIVENGGHFAAFGQPEITAKNFVDFLKLTLNK